jgi:superoxide dismutase, Fe-Mn family
VPLQLRELPFYNSMTLHEAYFASLGGDGKISGPLARALPSNWRESFLDLARSLSGGSGWATLSLVISTGELRLGWSGQHAQSLSGALPLLVLDMYEHAYALDFGANAAKYIDAFLLNLNWPEVERRYAVGLRIIAVVRKGLQ